MFQMRQNSVVVFIQYTFILLGHSKSSIFTFYYLIFYFESPARSCANICSEMLSNLSFYLNINIYLTVS